jgi:hypothetical protein
VASASEGRLSFDKTYFGLAMARHERLREKRWSAREIQASLSAGSIAIE